MAKPDIHALKHKLVQACRILAMEGQGDYIWGHVTVRLPDRPDHLLMKPARIGLDEITTDDVIGHRCAWDVILVGDMCYERPLAERLLEWLGSCAKGGTHVFLGDPGRSYFPERGTVRLATYRVQTSRELEDREIRETSVYRLTPDAAVPSRALR